MMTGLVIGLLGSIIVGMTNGVLGGPIWIGAIGAAVVCGGATLGCRMIGLS